LEEIESEYGKIFYHTNVRWFSYWFISQRFLHSLKEIELFMEKKNKLTEYLDGEGWMSDLAFFVGVTGHLNTINT
jgi:hypothetical protein